MDRTILDFVNILEGWKTAIKNLHWNSNSLSMHKQCDEIAEEISEFQDIVSEVEQGISGNLPYNELKGKEYHITTISKFLEDVIKDTTVFYKKLEGMGDKYIGLHSECESFLTKMQREVYLINFTLKEDFKRNYAQKVNENKMLSIDENELSNVIQEAVHNTVDKILNEIGDTHRGQYMLGRLGQKKRLNGIANNQDYEQSGTNDIFRYANNKQEEAPNDIEGRRNAFYNGWHSSEGNKQYGYDYFKGMDEAVSKSITNFLKTL